MKMKTITTRQDQDDRLLSPYDIERIQEDPAELEKIVRAMGAVNLENLVKVMQSPDINPAARIEFQKLLNKMGRLEPQGSTETGTGPQVVINITRALDKESGVTIEGTAQASLT